MSYTQFGVPPPSLSGSEHVTTQDPVGVTTTAQIAGLAGPLPAYPRIITGTTGTLTAADNGGGVQCTNGSPVTLIVPAGLGAFSCYVVQTGAGRVTPMAQGTAVSNRQAFTQTAGQNAIISLISISANNFVLGGDAA